jgi:hypothetical protein
MKRIKKKAQDYLQRNREMLIEYSSEFLFLRFLELAEEKDCVGCSLREECHKRGFLFANECVSGELVDELTDPIVVIHEAPRSRETNSLKKQEKLQNSCFTWELEKPQISKRVEKPGSLEKPKIVEEPESTPLFLIESIHEVWGNHLFLYESLFENVSQFWVDLTSLGEYPRDLFLREMDIIYEGAERAGLSRLCELLKEETFARMEVENEGDS